MNELEEKICEIAGGSICRLGQTIQELWSGYGTIRKATVDNKSVVVKCIDASEAKANRRGWQSEFAHQRKIKSYEVECSFYENYADRCKQECRVADLFGSFHHPRSCRWLLVIEDLDASGFSRRESDLKTADLYACLSWLANFHAEFLDNVAASELWPTGTYWHLETRPGEFQAMQDGPLKDAAEEINRTLNSANHQTLVHGDAKVANFCFHAARPSVKAVDFQYVGGGVGIKDVAYFISSCLSENEAEQREQELLGYYFHSLMEAVSDDVDFISVEREWRELYPFAWADFCRFLQGWSPSHWKLNGYSMRMTDLALSRL